MNKNGKCGQNATWTLNEESVLVISGIGKVSMTDEQYIDRATADNLKACVKQVIINDGITCIDRFAFFEYSMINISIPDSVTSIKSHAFEECRNLERIKIPYGITKIEHETFFNALNLAEIEIPETVNFFAHNAFLFTAWLLNKKQSIVIVNDVVCASDFMYIHEAKKFTPDQNCLKNYIMKSLEKIKFPSFDPHKKYAERYEELLEIADRADEYNDAAALHEAKRKAERLLFLYNLDYIYQQLDELQTDCMMHINDDKENEEYWYQNYQKLTELMQKVYVSS